MKKSIFSEAQIAYAPSPRAANHVWAHDFVVDSCANGQKLEYPTVVDEFTREWLAIDVADSTRSGRVIEVLSRLMSPLPTAFR